MLKNIIKNQSESSVIRLWGNCYTKSWLIFITSMRTHKKTIVFFKDYFYVKKWVIFKPTRIKNISKLINSTPLVNNNKKILE